MEKFALKLTATCCFFIGMALGQSADDASIPIRFRPDVLAGMSIDHPLPQYPLTSLRQKKEGLVVASLQIDTAGKVTSVDIQVSPDEDLKAAVAKSLVHWTFRPSKLHGVAHPAQGRLMVYFQCKGATGEVVIPGITDKTK